MSSVPDVEKPQSTVNRTKMMFPTLRTITLPHVSENDDMKKGPSA